jgi:hypothetical protein
VGRGQVAVIEAAQSSQNLADKGVHNPIGGQLAFDVLKISKHDRFLSLETIYVATHKKSTLQCKNTSQMQPA